MAASRSMGAFSGPTQGAQSPVPVAPMAVPSPGPSSFAQVLQSMVPPAPMPSSMPPMPDRMGQAMPPMPGRMPPRMPQDAQERPGIAALAQHMARPPSRPVDAPAPPAPPTGFVPGVPGIPEGPSGIAIVKDHPEKISHVLGELRAQNPSRKIKAPAFVDAWNAKHPDLPLNLSRARTVLARNQAAEERQQLAQMQQYLLSGAKKALGSG